MTAVSTTSNQAESSRVTGDARDGSQVGGPGFRRAARLSQGYHVGQVDDFFARAREVYEQGAEEPAVSSSDVRRVGFDLVRGGYDIGQVDSALDRLEDERQVPVQGTQPLGVLLHRLAGPGKERPHVRRRVTVGFAHP